MVPAIAQESRLMIVQETLDTAEPVQGKQCFHDRRDSNMCYTFWFAVAAIALTLIISLVQSITGTLGVA